MFVHELGHFLAARFFGVQVNIFSIGFGPKLFSIKDKKKTVWQVCAVPLGGYVQMPMNQLFGLKKSVISLAGPFMNFIFSFMLFFAVIFANGFPTIKPIVRDVMPGSMAQKYDIRTQDEIVSINGKSVEEIQNVLKQSKQVELKIKRGQDELIKQIEMTQDKLGVIFETTVQKIGFIASAKKSFMSVALICSKMFWSLFSWASFKDVGSVISVFSISKTQYEHGIYAFLSFIAFLSVNLGFINLLPIPVLDGGYVCIGFYEMVTRKRLNKNLHDRIMVIGFLLLLLLMTVSIFNDIFRR